MGPLCRVQGHYNHLYICIMTQLCILHVYMYTHCPWTWQPQWMGPLCRVLLECKVITTIHSRLTHVQTLFFLLCMILNWRYVATYRMQGEKLRICTSWMKLMICVYFLNAWSSQPPTTKADSAMPSLKPCFLPLACMISHPSATVHRGRSGPGRGKIQ